MQIEWCNDIPNGIQSTIVKSTTNERRKPIRTETNDWWSQSQWNVAPEYACLRNSQYQRAGEGGARFIVHHKLKQRELHFVGKLSLTLYPGSFISSPQRDPFGVGRRKTLGTRLSSVLVLDTSDVGWNSAPDSAFQRISTTKGYRVCSHDVTAAMLETWNILLGIKFYFYANPSFNFIMQIWRLVTWANTLYSDFSSKMGPDRIFEFSS